MPKPQILCYVLADPTGQYLWHAPGFRPVRGCLDLDAVASWPTLAEAREAAAALKRVLNISSRPLPLTWRAV